MILDKKPESRGLYFVFVFYLMISSYNVKYCVGTGKNPTENAVNQVCSGNGEESELNGELWGNPNKAHVSCNRPGHAGRDIPLSDLKMSTKPIERLSPVDPNSFSRPDLCVVRHLHLTLDVNFEKHVLKGSAKLQVEKVDQKTNTVVKRLTKLA